MSETRALVRVLVLFGQPVDEDAFFGHFNAVHLGLVDALAGLQGRTINYVAGAISGAPPFQVSVELAFADEPAMQHALNSAAGQAMARDYANFASGGVTVLLCRAEETAAE